jgi:tetratricopeptide (TPR) repeat protein
LRHCSLRFALVPAFVVLASLTSFPRISLGQSKAPASTAPAIKPSAPDYSQEPFVFQQMDSSVTFAADGTGAVTQTVVVKYQSDSAVHEGGVLQFPYAAREQTLTIDYVRVRKPDGRIIETPADDIQDMPTEITQQAPLYSDSRVKQIPIKGLSAGDTVEYQIHLKIEHPAVPGQFGDSLNFIRSAIVLQENVVLRVPKDKYVKVASKDVQPVITEEDGEKVYRWHTSNLEPAPKDKKKKKDKAANENQPSIELTTFKDWAEIGAWYGALQKDRVEVTPEIKSRAQELTKGLTTDEDKIKAIYTYVSTQFRYIGVDFGIGRYQPHHASEVLDNQYGDCKDKHTLLASLLKAEGYTAWPALIRADSKLRPEVPSPAQFNHVITAVQLNGKTLWLDSTVETSPFQLLLAGLRGQQALLIADNGPAHLVTTPEDPPYPMSDRWRAVGTLSERGVFNGHFDITMRNDSEPIFRIVYRNVARGKWDQATEGMLAYEGFAGTVTNADASAPNDLSQPFHFTFDYERKDFGDWDNLRIYPMLPTWRFEFGKNDDKPTDPIAAGDFGESVFRSEITLPKGYSAEVLPPTNIHNDFVDYSNTTSVTNGVLVTERKFNVKKNKIPPSSWDEYLRWQKAVIDDENGMVQILRPGEKSQGDSVDSPQARDLLQQAYSASQRGDRETALKLLEDVKKINPKQPGLFYGYGYLYLGLGQKQTDQAIAAFRQEAENQPQNADFNLRMVTTEVQLHRINDAVSLARIISDGAPDNLAAKTQLGLLLLNSGHAAEAITVLEKASAAPDAKPNVKVQLARAYIKANRISDAEPLLKGLIQGSDDAGILNDASYELTDSGLDLPFAMDASLKSLHLQEIALAAANLDHVTDQNLRAVDQVSFVWDTVGWAYFRAGQLDQAESFARASWTLRPTPTRGVHLGEILEAQGKSKEAMEKYRLALAAANGSEDDITAQAWKHLGEKPPAQTQDLSAAPSMNLKIRQPGIGDLIKLRSVKVPKRDNQSGSAEFYVLLTPAGVEDVRFISGKDALRSEADNIRKAQFNSPFPAGSQAKLIRRGILDCSAVEKDCDFVLIEPNYARAK